MLKPVKQVLKENIILFQSFWCLRLFWSFSIAGIISVFQFLSKKLQNGQFAGRTKSFSTVRKSVLKVWWRNVVKDGKYSRAKFANFVYICITRGKSYHF